MRLFKLLFFATVFMTSCEQAQTTGKPADTKAIETKKMEGTPAATTALPIENAAPPKADALKATTDAPKADALKATTDAPKADASKAAEAPKTAATMYECPMKCEKPSAKAGKCGKCKMDLKAIAQK
jgi:hypothetical protein